MSAQRHCRRQGLWVFIATQGERWGGCAKWKRPTIRQDLQLCHQRSDASLCLDAERPARYGPACYQGFSEQGWRGGMCGDGGFKLSLGTHFLAMNVHFVDRVFKLFLTGDVD